MRRRSGDPSFIEVLVSLVQARAREPVRADTRQSATWPR
jgi:hypothetical protein